MPMLFGLLAAFVLLSQPAVSGRKGEKRQHRGDRSPQAEVFFCETPNVACRTKIDEFEIDGTRDLFIFVAWRGVRGAHAQELRLILPDGNHYQTLATHFTTEPTAPSSEIQVAKRSRGEPTVVSALAVGGTFITQHMLSGTWGAKVYLDGKLVNESSFILRPSHH